MSLNPTKTKSMTVTSRQQHQLGISPLSLSLNNTNVEHVSSHRLLGIEVDNQLRWNAHIEKMSKTLSKNVFLFSKLKQYINTKCRKLFFFAHIKPSIDYLSTIWDGASQNLLTTPNSLYRRAVKMILYESNISTNMKFKKLEILPLVQQLRFNKSTLMHKIVNNKAPNYLQTDMAEKIEKSKKSRTGTIKLPETRIDLCKTSLFFSGPKIWNDLPRNIKKIAGPVSFKCTLKKYLLSEVT